MSENIQSRTWLTLISWWVIKKTHIWITQVFKSVNADDKKKQHVKIVTEQVRNISAEEGKRLYYITQQQENK